MFKAIDYITISGTLMAHTDYTSTEKLFISLLIFLTRKGTTGSTASNAYLARRIGVSPAYVAKMLEKLKKFDTI